jgi:hypothetical protein
VPAAASRVWRFVSFGRAAPQVGGWTFLRGRSVGRSRCRCGRIPQGGAWGRAHCLRACARAGTAARTGSACAGGYRIQQCGRLVPRRSHPRRGPTLRRERCLLPRSQLHVRDAPQNAHGTFAQRAACDCRRSARPYRWPATRKRKCSGAGRRHCRRARANRSRTRFPRRAEARTRRRRAPVFAPCERSGPRPKCASLLGHRLVGATLFPAASFPL